VTDWPLKYGLNPYQGEASATFPDGAPWLTVLNGQVGYINLLDATKAWALARELAVTLAVPSAASIKHVHPAGAAIATPLDEPFRMAHQIGDAALSPVATAYARARAGDRIASFGDFIGLSEPVDESCAALIRREVSDGIIAPDYSASALAILRDKKAGAYIVLKGDPQYVPAGDEARVEHGVLLRQAPNRMHISANLFTRAVGSIPVPNTTILDLQLATIVAKHAPSNAVCIGFGGQAIGIGGGQQARIHATRSACEKADLWRLQLHPRAVALLSAISGSRAQRFNVVRQWLLWDELTEPERADLGATATHVPAPLSFEERAAWLATFPGVVMASDGYIPFADNVQRAARSAVAVIAQPGGSKGDGAVTTAADRAGIAMIHTGTRLFWH